MQKKLKNQKYRSVLDTVDMIPQQFLSTLGSKLVLPPDYKKINSVVLCGMGGSALGAHILAAQNICSVPFYFYNGYELPEFVGKDTLFIASSYSGSTEEALASLMAALNKGAKAIGIAAGGKLLDICVSKNIPFIKFDSKLNPSGQPRYGVGYALGSLLNIFINLGISKISLEDAKSASAGAKNISSKNAKKLATVIKGSAPIFVGADFLDGNMHLLTNQINETCKTFAEWHAIPELNHHLMEGLKRPAGIGKQLKFIFCESDLYSPRIIKRFGITKQVVKKNKIKYGEFSVLGKTKLEQALNCAALGSLASVILAEDYGEDPADIPWVNYFKKQLAG